MSFTCKRFFITSDDALLVRAKRQAFKRKYGIILILNYWYIKHK